MSKKSGYSKPKRSKKGKHRAQVNAKSAKGISANQTTPQVRPRVQKPKKEETKELKKQGEKNKKMRWKHFVRSLDEVFNFDQIIYGFGWILIFAFIFIHNSSSTIKMVFVGAFLIALIYRILRVVWHYRNPDKTIKKLYVLYLVEGLLVLGLFVFTLFQEESYYPAPARRLAFNLLISYLFVVCNVFILWRRLKYICMNLIVFISGLIVSQIIHYAYIDLVHVRMNVDGFFRSIMPRSDGLFMGEIQWLSIGLPLFASCLIVINWFKDRPCQAWNPYTVQEIGLCDHVVYFAVMLISSLLYCGINKMSRTPVIPLIALLLLNIYAMYLKNTQNLDGLVMRKVIKKTDVKSLIDTMVSAKDNDAVKWEGDLKEQFFTFSHSIKSISRTILSSDVSTDAMVTNYMKVLKSIYELVPDNEIIYRTIGFIFGLSSASLGLMEENKNTKVINVIQSINIKTSQKGLINDHLYKMLRVGMYAGYKKAIPENATIDIVFEGSKQQCEESKDTYRKEETDYIKFIIPDGQFYGWLLDEWIKPDKKSIITDKKADWEWVDDVWQEIK